jgi:hypothetical protein
MLGFEPIKLPLCFVCLRSVSCVRQCLCSSLIAPSVYLCVLFVFVLCLVPASVSVHPWLPLRFTFVFCLCSFCVLCPPVSLFILECPFGLPLCFVCSVSLCLCLCSSLIAHSVHLCVLLVLCLVPASISVHPWLPLRFTFIFCLCSFCVLCPVLPVSLFCVLCPALPVSLFCVLCQVLPVSLVSLDCPFGFFSDLFIPPLYHARKVSGHVFVC